MTEAAKYWRLQASIVPSVTSPDGAIVVVRGLAAAQKVPKPEFNSETDNQCPTTPTDHPDVVPFPQPDTPAAGGRPRVLADRQPEGRRRQDHDRHQSRHRAWPPSASTSWSSISTRRATPRPGSASSARRAAPRPMTCSPARPRCARRCCRPRCRSSTSRPRPWISPASSSRSASERDRAFRLRNALGEHQQRHARIRFHLRAGRLPAVAQSAHGQRHGGGRLDPGAAAMRVLRARRSLATC